jgi:serine/threonine protein kinase
LTLAAGSTFGSYRIDEPLGKGGMATVYKAYEAALDRYVALKVLPGEFLHDPTFAERFKREAKVIARLEHPNIIPIHAFGIEAGTPWMAMRLISGGALSGFLKDARLDAGRVVAILRGAAEALDYANGKSVVHRDVKPQNILLDEAERVYLADFGIAKLLESSQGLTATGMISGTPHYMAPEQASGQPVDHRADIYALGVVAYEMLTGRVPFAADTPVAVLMKHVSEPVPTPSPEEVPEPLVRALVKALAKRPDERYQTAVGFVKALEQGLAQLPTVPAVAVPTQLVAPVPSTMRTPSVSPTMATQMPQAAVVGGYPSAPPGYPTAPPGNQPPPYTGGYAPPPSGQYPPVSGQYPPVSGQYPPVSGQYPPVSGQYPPVSGQYPPVSGQYPPVAGVPSGMYPQQGGGGNKGLIIGLVVGAGLFVFAGAVLVVALIMRPSTPTAERPAVTPPPPTTIAGIPIETVPLPDRGVAAAVPAETMPPSPLAEATPRPVATPRAAAPPTQVAANVPPPTLPPAPVATTLAPAPAVPEVRLPPDSHRFTPEATVAIGVQSGPVKVPTARFTTTDKGPGKVELRTTFPVMECPKGEWELYFTVELLDSAGTVLNSFQHHTDCENESKASSFNKGMLKALVGAATAVRVRLRAEKD